MQPLSGGVEQDAEGYLTSFKQLDLGWVRFQDLDMDMGGTSLTQIFLAWPLSDEDLQAADVTKLASTPTNFNYTELDRQLDAALATNAKIDFRLGVPIWTR